MQFWCSTRNRAQFIHLFFYPKNNISASVFILEYKFAISSFTVPTHIKNRPWIRASEFESQIVNHGAFALVEIGRKRTPASRSKPRPFLSTLNFRNTDRKVSNLKFVRQKTRIARFAKIRGKSVFLSLAREFRD